MEWFLFGLQHWISPHSQPVAELVLGKIRPSVVFSGSPEILANHSLLTGSISPRVFYIGCIRSSCNRGITVFSHVAPYSFPYFKKGYISFVFHLKYFLFFFVNITRSSSPSTGFTVVSIFLAFEVPQGHRNGQHNSLKTIADLHFLGNTGLIKCQDVSVGLDSFFTFSDGDASYVCNSLFFKG